MKILNPNVKQKILWTSLAVISFFMVITVMAPVFIIFVALGVFIYSVNKLLQLTK
jgi:hypothetical protein